MKKEMLRRWLPTCVLSTLALLVWLISRSDAAFTPANPNGSATSANSQPMVIASDQASVSTRTNAVRNGGVLHRSAITAADKLPATVLTSFTAVTEAGSTLTNVATYGAVCAGNQWGNGTVSAVSTVTPTANQAVRLTIAQTTGATYYDCFVGLTSGAPLWVGRVTETQRAAGALIFSTVGTTSANSAPAGSIDVGIAGTGLASNVVPFTASNAYTPATPTAINCAGYSRAHIMVKLAPTDLRSLPALTIAPFFANQTSGSDWHQGTAQAMSVLSSAGYSLSQDFWVNVDGSTGLVVLIDTIAGQTGTAATIWVELE